MVTVKSVAEMSDKVRSFALTTPITCPAELVCSSASLQAATRTSAKTITRFIGKWCPQDHNIRTDGPGARSRPARAQPAAATLVQRTRRYETRRFHRTDLRLAGGRAGARRRTHGPRTPARAASCPRT